jgi:hypothetical protein
VPLSETVAAMRSDDPDEMDEAKLGEVGVMLETLASQVRWPYRELTAGFPWLEES